MTDEKAAAAGTITAPTPDKEIFPPPSQTLLDRAHAGWERFLASMEEAPDE
ncbi:hypothetical protein [Streptomyces sp. NPDC048606]|uniref:hypothetical protein n=1 Tax=Streptomyces sp. NPDC048606 TaxID=3154726 RepID=UPI0034387402